MSGEYVHPTRMRLSVLGLLSDEHHRISSCSSAWLVCYDVAPASETGESTPAGGQSSASESCDPSWAEPGPLGHLVEEGHQHSRWAPLGSRYQLEPRGEVSWCTVWLPEWPMALERTGTQS